MILFKFRSFLFALLYVICSDLFQHIYLVPFGKLMSHNCTSVTIFDAGRSRSTQTCGLAILLPQCLLFSLAH